MKTYGLPMDGVQVDLSDFNPILCDQGISEVYTIRR